MDKRQDKRQDKRRDNARFAVIGYGAITDEIVRTLAEQGQLEALLGVLVRPAHQAEATRKAAGRFAVVVTIDALLQLDPGVVAECAGHGAMREFATAVLRHGTDLLCASVGVLADERFAGELDGAASGGASVWIPSGAVAGIDGLLASRSAGLSSVTYASVKPPAAWIGTPAHAAVGAAAERRTTFFEGSARGAALQYPQNANVGATVALAGLGLDRTQVRLVSDPEASGPLGIIDAAGNFGSLRFEILAYASPRNPKTSLLTAHSILVAAREGVCFPVLQGRVGGSRRLP
jgi:aspartate dehydrogenase